MRTCLFWMFCFLSFPSFAQDTVHHGTNQPIRLRCGLSRPVGDPLFVVDGVVWERFQIQMLNAADIDSITIHKPPMATAIWGSRGQEGVIYIYMKDRLPGRLQIRSAQEGSLADVSVKLVNKHSPSDSIQLRSDSKGWIANSSLKYYQTYSVIAERTGYETLSFEWTPGPERDSMVQLIPFYKEIKGVTVSANGRIIKCSFGRGCFLGVIGCENITHVMSEIEPAEQSVGLFPNPVQAGGNITVELADYPARQVVIRLFDLSGRMLFSQTLPAVNSKSRILIPVAASLARGTYLVQVSGEPGKQWSSKILVQ